MKTVLCSAIIAVSIITLGCSPDVKQQTNLTCPPIVEPGQECGQPPANAIVLFDGTDLSQWQSTDANTIAWKIQDGCIQVQRPEGSKSQNIKTVRGFGDCQVHIEWATPEGIPCEGQRCGNSGVFLMGQYEVQVLDSLKNVTYPDGQAGAIYKQSVPMFNYSRQPGQWQSFDIIFRRPHFDAKGNLVKPAIMTVLHNGVVIHDNFALRGTTWLPENTKYTAHPDKLPLLLQDHGDPVRFRNIWVVELPERN